MSYLEQNYQKILHEVVSEGSVVPNRTGIDAKFIPSAMIKHHMSEGFPLMTLRELYWKGGTAEAQGFLRGYDDAAKFEALGCNFWTANANKPSAGSNTSEWLSSPHRLGENHLGDIYGVQWRKWMTGPTSWIDQIYELFKMINTRPSDRRMVVTAWNPDAVLGKKAALPPCHDSFVVMIDEQRKLMHLSWRQRSTDLILGTPTNLVCYGFLLALFARLTGYTPGTLTGHLDNVHVYQNHTHAIEPLLDRKSNGLPQLGFQHFLQDLVEDDRIPLKDQIGFLEHTTNKHLEMRNYNPHEKIPDLVMAV